MAYRYRFLTRDQFPQIHQAFLQAFADYYVETGGITEEVLYNRAVKNGVDFSVSVGAFDAERLVAMTLVGLDQWKGATAAFDIGTGVVPGHRGRGVAKEMFQFALPRLRERGATRFVLEVIQENQPAIKAYKAVGFEVTREFDCFRWELARGGGALDPAPDVDIRREERDSLDSFEAHLDWRPSWENSFSSIRRIPDDVRLFGAYSAGECVGLLVYYPGTNWVMTFVVKRNRRRRGVGSALLDWFARRRPGVQPVVRLVNIDRNDLATVSLLQKAGCELLIRQFEMELTL
jgi:ribosomal protein S18 acetylase RimI-like enzyme